MPSQRRTIEPEISLITSQNLREARLARKDEKTGKSWSMPRLSRELALHRCHVHPEGVELSAAVINHIENGVPRNGARAARTRSLSIDELYVLSEVLGVRPEDLMGWESDRVLGWE